MKFITEIIKSLGKSGLLIKNIGETIENKGKEQKGEFIRILLGALGASLFGNILTGKGVIATN